MVLHAATHVSQAAVLQLLVVQLVVTDAATAASLAAVHHQPAVLLVTRPVLLHLAVLPSVAVATSQMRRKVGG